MKIWTFLEAKTKIYTDSDLNDETFISPNEMSGYFNDGIKEAESEIHTMNAEADYFMTKYFIPVTTGLGKYSLPNNIYANKIRHIMYANGSIIYPVRSYRRAHRFHDILFTDQYGQADDYRYELYNDNPGQAMIQIHPVLREQVIYPPQAGSFTPMIMWYLRNAARIPMMAVGSNAAELCNPEVIAPSQVNTSTNVILHNSGTTNYGIENQGQAGCFPGSISYVTGDIVQVALGPGGGTLPIGLSPSTNYWVIAISSTSIQLASSLANAQNLTPISLISQPSISMTIRVAATQNIVNATLLDIPEFTEFIIQWAKCAAIYKELKAVPQGDQTALAVLKKSMIDALTVAIVDDDNTIEADYTSYMEHS